jgi:hypothetical protein
MFNLYLLFYFVGCDDYISDMLPAQPDGFCSLQTHFASRLCIPVPEYTAEGIRCLRIDKKKSFNGIGWDARSCLVDRDES